MNTFKEIANLFWQMIDGWLDDPVIATLCWLLVIWLVTDYILT
jgi:hypothetical protein